MSDETTKQEIPSTIVKNGGVEVEVTKQDGAKEKVSVRLIPYKHAEKYLEFIADMPQLVGLLIDKPEEYVESLTDDSLFEIDAIGRKINDPRLDRLLVRQAQAVGQIKPLMEKASALTNSLRTPS